MRKSKAAAYIDKRFDMCGIVGYTGFQNAEHIVIDGLKTLEYRGYDSAGIALVDGEISAFKTAGRVRALEETLPAGLWHTAIGHTRWATHGKPSALNAHPHLSFDGKIAVVHNGVLENQRELTEELSTLGIDRVSETDSELIAHMLALEGGDMLEAVRHVGERLEGAATFLAVRAGDCAIYAYRQGASMAVGEGEGESFAASDSLALSRYIKKAIMLSDGEYAKLTKSGVEIYFDGERVTRAPISIRRTPPGECVCHMRAEIDEIPEALKRTFNKINESADEELLSRIRGAKRILLTGCGTAYHACLYGKAILEKTLDIAAEATPASEFDRVRLKDDCIAICVTQSGETADAIDAIKRCKKENIYTVALTNVEESYAAALADRALFLDAGAEIAVAATKTYDCQLLALYMLAKAASGDKMTLSEFAALKEEARRALSLDELYEDRIADSKLMFIGKGLDCVTAREGALKFKEITYKQTDAYPAGELKHGTVALVDGGVTVIVVATAKSAKSRIEAAVSELNSRGAYTVAVSAVGDVGAKRTLEISGDIGEELLPIVAAIPLQNLALTTSLCLGLNPDKPRNLAKSVTVI